MYKDKTAILFVFTAFVAGLCSAFFYPLSSLFIVEELGAEPIKLSLYMFLSVVSSVAVSQLLAAKSDANWSRKTILLVALVCYLITVSSFTLIRDYWTVVVIATVFGSVSGASFGQLFALGREYADKHVANSTSFLSTMRAGIAIAWVFGPPLAFMLKASFGFNASFLVSAAIILLGIVVIVLFLPDGRVEKEAQPSTVNDGIKSVSQPGLIALYCLALVAAFSANNLYITSMPLYLSQELRVDPNWLGFLFGAAALCEIPVMLWAGKLAQRMGTIKLMTLAVASGALFYIIMLSSTSFIAMLTAQLLNGFFIGVCATLGMVVLQDMMRDRLGTASTLFTSMLSISMLMSSLSVGVVAQLFDYYSTLYVSLAGSSLAMVLLTLFAAKTRVEGGLGKAVA
ncbi:MFS transporter [Vibrio sp. JPW-9-11-11]|uniref:sugar efflux transporter n=1 Tax=Vibrio sp. JPW-9-11-11 TaxID=1416532 RepID=UPI0015947036|nr:sugar efflux transporter [Vibrio sp. JPW-9-11-11]NVD08740.1 MFS transporter [Vibrio sp. JPW-9-11-11]